MRERETAKRPQDRRKGVQQAYKLDVTVLVSEAPRTAGLPDGELEALLHAMEHERVLFYLTRELPPY